MKLQSSVRGAIKKLLVVYNPDTKSIIGELCYKLNHHTQLVIWADGKTHLQELKNFLDERKISHSETLKSDISKCLIFADNNKFVEWVRDPFLVLSEPEKINVIRSSNCEQQASNFEKLNKKPSVSEPNLSLAEILETEGIIHGIIKPRELPCIEPCTDDWFVIESGNILIDDDFIFIGGDQFKILTILLGLDKDCSGEQEAIKLIHELFRTNEKDIKIHILGYESLCDNKNQINSICPCSEVLEKNANEPALAFPPFPGLIHIDLYITLTGVKTDEDRHVLLVGQPMNENWEIIYHEEKNIIPIIQQLEAIKTKAGKQKFLIKRNPMIRVKDSPDSEPYTFSYNNCLVEVLEPNGPNTVWLPQFSYGDTSGKRIKFDREVRSIWEQLGFRVVFIEADFHPFCRVLGSLHCLTNELLRK